MTEMVFLPPISGTQIKKRIDKHKMNHSKIDETNLKQEQMNERPKSGFCIVKIQEGQLPIENLQLEKYKTKNYQLPPRNGTMLKINIDTDRKNHNAT